MPAAQRLCTPALYPLHRPAQDRKRLVFSNKRASMAAQMAVDKVCATGLAAIAAGAGASA